MPLKVMCAGCSKDERDAAEATVKAALGTTAGSWMVSLVKIGRQWSVTVDGPDVKHKTLVVPDGSIAQALRDLVPPPAAPEPPAAPSAPVTPPRSIPAAKPPAAPARTAVPAPVPAPAPVVSPPAARPASPPLAAMPRAPLPPTTTPTPPRTAAVRPNDPASTPVPTSARAPAPARPVIPGAPTTPPSLPRPAIPRPAAPAAVRPGDQTLVRPAATVPRPAAAPASPSRTPGPPRSLPPPRPGVRQDRYECQFCGGAFVVLYESPRDSSQETVAVACPHCWKNNHVMISEEAALSRDYRAEKA